MKKWIDHLPIFRMKIYEILWREEEVVQYSSWLGAIQNKKMTFAPYEWNEENDDNVD